MLLQFSCSNHRSIKDKVTFSMLSSESGKRASSIKTLRIATIYGSNGSGKSNFINAIDLSKQMVVNSINHQPGQLVTQMPHKLLGTNVPSWFEYQFIKEGTRFAYGFSVKAGLIDEEYLYFFPNNRKTNIFERKGLTIVPGSKYKNAFTVVKEVFKENRLFLSCAANYSSVKEIEMAFRFFNEDITVYKPNVDEPRQNNWFEYSITTLENDPVIKSLFIRVLKSLGTGIVDVKTKIETLDIERITEGAPDPIKNLLRTPEFSQNSIPVFHAKVVYDKFETDLAAEESTGIQQLFKIICPLLDILMKGRILFCDEIETGLHESIVKNIIKLFSSYIPEKNAQLIFSTHDTSLLDSDLFDRDQVWFTQLTEERATDLYSLTEIKNVRKDENLAKGYINGKYGAIPMLNANFINELCNG